MTALITEFNHLGGNSIQEHKKLFCLYGNKLAALDVPERLHVLNNLRAEHRQEEIFLTKLLLKFEQTEKLKHLILQGDRILNKVIVCHKPFIFRDDDVNYFMDELFPNVSYIVRNRCLNNLAKIIKRDDVGEEFFKQVLERYGIKTAQVLLPVCNEAFIREIITSYRVVFRERQLVTLFQRFGSSFISFYYAECFKYGLTKQFGDQPFFSQYLSTKDIVTFCQLLKYGEPKLSTRGFKKFLSIKKDEYLTAPTKYSSFVKPKILYRLLTKEEFRMYFLNKLPKNQYDFSVYSMLDDLKNLKIEDRGSFLAGVFKDKYGFEIYTKEVDYHLKSLLTGEDLLKFVMTEEETLEYLPPSKSFPLIKERINLTSDINTRCQLVLKLFKSSKVNNDDEGLMEALKYFNQRHKNDQSSIREDVFTYIKENYKMENLSADIWQYLHELILAEQMISEYPHTLRDMFAEVLNYKFVNGLDFNAEFKKYVKNVGCHYFDLTSKSKDLKRWILLHLPEMCREVFTDENEKKSWPTAFLNVLQRWNKDNPKDIISYFNYPEIIESAIEHHNDDRHYYYDDVIASDILTFKTTDPKEIKLRNDLMDAHISKFAASEKMWRWLLKHRMEVVVKHIDLFYEKYVSTYSVRNLIYELMKMHYTPLPAIVREKSLQLFNDSMKSIEMKDEENKVSASQRNLALLALSFEKDFMKMIDNDRCYPSSEAEAEVNVLDESFKETLRLREQVVECLRNRPCSQEVMPMVMRFCFKDYFKCTLPVLNVVLYNLPERELAEPLRILQNRSVTVRKRALFYATTLGNAQTSCDALKYAGENEKNKSLQKFVFNRTFKNFCFVGNQASWELLLEHFKFVFEKDTETHTMVFQFNLISRNYLALYVETVWQFIGKQWKDKHTCVLNAINADIMTLLSDKLCDDIIHFSLVHSKEQLISSDVDFIYSYLLSSGEKIDHRFDLVANNARIVVDEDSQLDFKEFNKKSQNIGFLYKDICRRLMEKDEEECTHLAEKKMLVNKLAQAFPNLPLPYNHLDYQLQIEVCRCFLDDADKLPELFIKLQKDVLERHGAMMLDYFNEFASSLIGMLGDEMEYRLSFVQKLLEKENLTSVKLLAIHLMPSVYPSSEVCASNFRNIMEKIEAESAPVVLLYLNRYLKNLSI